jgi:hypothetical protein
MNFLIDRNLHKSDLIRIALLLSVAFSLTAYTCSSGGSGKTKPSVVVHASTELVILPCSPGEHSPSGSCPTTANSTVALTALAKDFRSQILYTYTVTGGRITGEGSEVRWDLSGVGPGTYTATVEAKDFKGRRAISSVIVKVMKCLDCAPLLVCPTVSVSCPDSVNPGDTPEFKAVLSSPYNLATYKWTIAGNLSEKISGGQDTSTITVNTNGLGGKMIIATVNVTDIDPTCGTITGSCPTAVKP